METLDIKVTHIKDRWHARLFKNGDLIDEMACNQREDIGWICREMLRWVDKNGSDSQFASAARKRQSAKHVGKVWYKNQLKD